MSTTPEVRDNMIDQAQQERMARDVKIMQKVNAVNRVAFKTRFPGACEHMMRLVSERLQAVLTNKPKDLGDPATWTATAEEIAYLAEALYNLTKINREYPVEDEHEHSK
jgi:hypothetical protein